MGITRGKGEWGETEEGMRDIRGDEGGMTWGGEHTVQYADNILQN